MNARTWMARGLAGAALIWLAGGDVAARAQQPATVAASATGLKPAAVVNGEPISMAELEAVLKQAPMAVEMPDQVRVQMRRHALAMLIDDTLMQQFIKANAPQVPKAEVDQKIAEMDADLKKEKKSVEAFCKENGQTVEQLKEGLTSMTRCTTGPKGSITDADGERYYT